MAPSMNNFYRHCNRFLSDTKLIQYLLIFISLFNLSLCLYEDQVGKFDWKQNYVGRIKFATFDTVSTTKKIIVATEENVLAALNLKSGQLIWRRVYERGYAGQIRALGCASEREFVTISGWSPAVVRVWDLATGHMIKEWTLDENLPGKIEKVKILIKDGHIHYIVPIYNKGFQITTVDTRNEKSKVNLISAPYINKEIICELAQSYLVCWKNDASKKDLIVINIIAPKEEARFITLDGAIFGPGIDRYVHFSSVLGDAVAISVTDIYNEYKRIVLFDENKRKFEVMPRAVDLQASLYITTVDNRYVLLEARDNLDKSSGTEVTAYDLVSSEHQPHLSFSLIYNSLQSPQIIASICPRQTKGITCRHLLSFIDNTVALLQHNKLLWTREEALANIVNVEILELPMSDRDQAIETEFDQKERDIVSMFVRRISSQINQAKAMLQSFMSPPPTNQRADLVRDRFGLHKMIVAVTSVGKIYGIETKKGEIIWQLRVPNIRGLTQNSTKMVLYVQRGSRHFPHPSQCALLAADKTTGNGVIYTFDPISGQPLGGRLQLDYKIKQTTLLHVPTDDFIRGILLLDEHDKAHVFPENAQSVAMSVGKNTYMFTANPETGVLAGFSFSYSTSENLIADKVWEIVLSPKNQKIVQVIPKNPIERVHSQGRVLSDRSVLYKYINPNLVAVVTQGTGNTQKDTLSLYLLDVISGAMIFSIVHKKVREPIHVVHSENWLVYSYYNKKSRRTEIASLELYEGKTQSNTTAFSSLTNTKLPIVERQAYIFPAVIESMRETITEKGITSKHILVSLANGGILEMPWALIDPRRPVNPEFREEGVIPYMPEIPIPMDSIINYNQSVFRTSGIYTSPSGLESTCLVFVHGLDLFYTRVAPSKTFDVLKEDFDYYLIVIVLSALMIASYITKKLASQKAQKQAWK